MRLLRLLQMCQEKGGLGHLVAIQQLRRWLVDTPEAMIIDQMQQIRNVPLLKYLQEAGLPGRVYGAFIDHLATLD